MQKVELTWALQIFVTKGKYLMSVKNSELSSIEQQNYEWKKTVIDTDCEVPEFFLSGTRIMSNTYYNKF